MRILVRAPNWIGDQVLAYPFFHYLRKAYPKAEITSICVPWVENLQYKGLVNHTKLLRPAVMPGFWEKWKNLDTFGKQLRCDGPWDLSFALPDSFSAAWVIARSGAEKRRGYRFEGRGFLLNDSLPLPDDERGIVHRAQAYVDLLPEEARPKRPISEFWGIPAENELDDPIPGEVSQFDFDRYWPGPRLPVPKERYWVLAPGATADSRRWPVEYFIHLAREIARTTDLIGLVVGGPKEAPLAERLCQIEELRLHDVTAKGPVPMLAEIFRNAEFTVTNESGLAHVASFCGSFTQIICGAADPRRTKPIGPGNVQVSLNAVACWPCEKNVCMNPLDQQIICLKGIRPENVWKEILSGLKKVRRE